MISRHEEKFDVIVAGAGPAGIAAALEAVRFGQRVGVLDDNPRPGGQIWRGGPFAHSGPRARHWLQRLGQSDVRVISGARVVDCDSGRIHAESSDDFFSLEYRSLVLATGARELFLPFPGWTLGNVFGAGGLQAMVKSGLPIEGKRVVIAGTGPLLLAVAAYLAEAGARVVCICEQTSRARLARFACSIGTIPGKLIEGLQLRKKMGFVPYWTNCWPTAALGSAQIEAVQLSHGGRKREIPCDYLACGFHLVPNLELAKLMGCRIRDGFVDVDEFQQTSTPNVFSAGEPTGIGGLELSLAEGQVAGASAANRKDLARDFFAQRARYRRAVGAMRRAFELRNELQPLAQPKTILCRCEDVPFEKIRVHGSWREAKLHTRCGMGPCQGRICGAAVEFLFGWDVGPVRPPIFPARLESLAAKSGGPDAATTHGG
ncbi:MAG: FAD/NAD(P)-binding oxidoreductase [Candidatus Acidiferrales bacterium]